jgi:hypothetical protein
MIYRERVLFAALTSSVVAASASRILSSEGPISCLLCNILQKHSLERGETGVFVLRVRDASVVSNCDGGGHPRSSRFEVVRRNYPQRAGRRGRENAEQGPGGISGDMGDLLSICGMRLGQPLKLLVISSLATCPCPCELRLALCNTSSIVQRSKTG